MTAGDDDRKFLELFQSAHGEDRPPAFAPPSAGTRDRPRSPLRWGAAALLLASTLLVARLLWSPGPQRPAPSAPGALQLAQWRGPLDFLLRTPGSDLLQRAPAFDTKGSWK